eukprot:240884-Chlamydomonas_euryale.AAC.1
MLVGTDPLSDGLPLTNTLLAELQRRGVSRDQLLSTLQELGGELPAGAVRALRAAKSRHAGVRVLSAAANSVFVSHLLAGGKAAPFVDAVIACPAAFERVDVAAAE